MKASELIYRLARAIEDEGDKELHIALETKDFKLYQSIPVKCLDVRPFTGDDVFEIYGEEK